MSNRPTFAVGMSLTTAPLVAPSWTDETENVRGFTMTRGRQQELDVVQPGTATLEVNNSGRRFDPYNAAGPHFGTLLPGRRVRIRATYGNEYLSLPGVGTAYASAPDHARLDVAGDLDVRADVALTDYTAAAEQTLVAKWNNLGVNQRSYDLGVTTGGNLILRTSADGSASTVAVTSSATLASVGIADGARVRVRATLDVSDAGNRVVRFYYSTDSLAVPLDETTDWTQLGTTSTTAGTTSIYASTAELRVGALTSAGPLPAAGKFYAAAVLSGIAGTAVALPVFTNGQRFAADATTGTDRLGNPWTIAGTADLVGASYDVFGGFSTGWPVPDLKLGRAPIPLVDGFGLLTSATVNEAASGSPVEAVIAGLGPVHWYKLDEPASTSPLVDSGSFPVGGLPKGSALLGLGSTPGLDPGNTEATCFDGAADGRIDVAPYEWLSCCFLMAAAAVGSDSETIYQDGNRLVVLRGTGSGFAGLLEVSDRTDGNGSSIRVDDGAAHAVVIRRTSPGEFVIYVDGVDVTTERTAGVFPSGPSAAIASQGYGVSDFCYLGRLQHFAVFYQTLSSTEAVELSGAATAWIGETIDERIGRLLDAAGWPTSERDLDVSDAAPLGAAAVGSDSLSDIRTLEQSEGGLVWQAPDYTLRFRSRYALGREARSLSPLWILSDEPGEDRFRFENPTVAPQGDLIRNRVTVGWTGGTITVSDQTSIDAYGIAEHELDTVLTSAEEATSLGELILYRFAQPIDRISSLDLNLAAEPLGWEIALGAEIGDRVKVVWTPGNVGDPIEIEALVDGKTVSAADVGTARATLWLSAAYTADLWPWGEAGWAEATVWG